MDPVGGLLTVLGVLFVLALPAAALAGLVWAVGLVLSVLADGAATFVRPDARG